MSADLHELTAAALRASQKGEAVEAYAQESRRTEVRARAGDVESVTFAESRGVGIRVIADGRMGYAWAADPTPAEVVEALGRARDNAALATEDEHNVLPAPEQAEALHGLFRPAFPVDSVFPRCAVWAL